MIGQLGVVEHPRLLPLTVHLFRSNLRSETDGSAVRTGGTIPRPFFPLSAVIQSGVRGRLVLFVKYLRDFNRFSCGKSKEPVGFPLKSGEREQQRRKCGVIIGPTLAVDVNGGECSG